MGGKGFRGSRIIIDEAIDFAPPPVVGLLLAERADLVERLSGFDLDGDPSAEVLHDIEAGRCPSEGERLARQGYESRAEWLEDRRERALAAMTVGQRAARWWLFYSPVMWWCVGLPTLVGLIGWVVLSL